MKHILITGGAGFIGYHLALKLCQEKNNSIDIVDDLTRGKYDKEFKSLISQPSVNFIAGDLTKRETTNNLTRKYDEVYHLAAILGVRNVNKRPQDVIRVNALSTLNTLDWFVQSESKKLLFSSTSETYAWTGQFFELPIPTPENVPLSLTDLHNPRITYAGSKIFGELAVTQYCIQNQKSFTIVRYHNVYGPRMGMEHVIPEILYRAKMGENPLSVYSPDHSRAFCYIDDAIKATIRSMRNRCTNGKTINIGNDLEEIRIKDLAKRILCHAKINVEIVFEKNVNDPIIRRCPDITLARELLEYKPLVSLDQGLEKTIAWYSHDFDR